MPYLTGSSLNIVLHATNLIFSGRSRTEALFTEAFETLGFSFNYLNGYLMDCILVIMRNHLFNAYFKQCNRQGTRILFSLCYPAKKLK